MLLNGGAESKFVDSLGSNGKLAAAAVKSCTTRLDIVLGPLCKRVWRVYCTGFGGTDSFQVFVSAARGITSQTVAEPL